MKKRYLPFGYAVRDGNIVVDTEQRTIVQNIFTAYLAGNTFQQIAKSMISKGIEYHQNDAEWNKNTISRILGNETYCGTDRYPPIVTKEIFRQAAQVRSAKASAYSAALAPFRKDIQCGCCGERLYWHGKTNQWHCRQCRMWSAPIRKTPGSSRNITSKIIMRASSVSRCSAKCKPRSPAETVSRQPTNASAAGVAITANMPCPSDCSAVTAAALTSG